MEEKQLRQWRWNTGRGDTVVTEVKPGLWWKVNCLSNHCGPPVEFNVNRDDAAGLIQLLSAALVTLPPVADGTNTGGRR